MTAVTENDLKRLEDLILNGQKLIESRLTAIEAGQTEIKSEITILKDDIKALELGQSEIKGEIEALDARITGLKERGDDPSGWIKSMSVGFFGILGIFVTAIVGILGKIVFFPIAP